MQTRFKWRPGRQDTIYAALCSRLTVSLGRYRGDDVGGAAKILERDRWNDDEQEDEEEDVEVEQEEPSQEGKVRPDAGAKATWSTTTLKE